MNWNDFFHMGGYAFYVWTSWGLSLLILLFLFTQAKWRNAKIRSQIKQQIEREKLAKQTAERGSISNSAS